MMTKGIVYEPLDEWWTQDIIMADDDVPTDRLVRVSHAPLDHVVVDSGVEAEIARALDMSDAVKVFAKLPKAFKVNTPLGTYNPDWAIALRRGDREDVYLICESKGDLNALRDAEKAQVECGKAHFASLDVPFLVATAPDDILKSAFSKP